MKPVTQSKPPCRKTSGGFKICYTYPMNWLLPLGILIFFECVADIFSKNWAMKGGWILATGALAAYLLANTFWLFALRNGSGLGKGAVIFSICSAVIAIMLGVFIYNEHITKLQYLGVFLGIISLVLIFWE